MAKSGKQNTGRSGHADKRDPQNVEFDNEGWAYDPPTTPTSTVTVSGRGLGRVLGALGSKKTN